MKKLMYYPIHADELHFIFDSGILPDKHSGAISLFEDKETAYHGFVLFDGLEPDYIIPVLVEESLLTSESYVMDYEPITVHFFKGVLSLNDISLNRKDILTEL